MNAISSNPGIHGKLPSHGDFITRRLPRDFVDVWDGWLQRAISTSKTELGEGWLETYLTSPIWSFALTPGICGEAGWAGVLMPSVDRVGRYFPLTVAVAVSTSISPCEVLMSGAHWFERARALALSSLEENEFSLDAFDASVADLGVPAADDGATGDAFQVPAATAGQGWHLPLPVSPAATLMQLTHGLIEERLGRYGLWWSEGSELVPSCALLSPSLPDPSAYSAFLDGRFKVEHWVSMRASLSSSPPDGAVA
jgi:type VI secretion system protein ImpM